MNETKGQVEPDHIFALGTFDEGIVVFCPALVLNNSLFIVIT